MENFIVVTGLYSDVVHTYVTSSVSMNIY